MNKVFPGTVKCDLLNRGGCGDGKCIVCCSGGRGDCRKNGAGYRISCQECPLDGLVADYEGETGINAYSWGLEHQNSINEDESSPLWPSLYGHPALRKKS